MLNELSHYLKKSYTKGSSVEIANAQESENENRVEIITYPKYIIYDFETDTSTDIHKPNHVEIDILKLIMTLHIIMTLAFKILLILTVMVVKINFV